MSSSSLELDCLTRSLPPPLPYLMQAQSVPSELVMKLFGSLNAITFSPIVTIEPRRRKFHCPIKLKIPLPPGYRPESSGNLRLLCSITGGQSKAIWEDVTGSTPLSIHDKSLLFTTTVSARFWLVHCQRAQRCPDAARFAQELWRFLCQVPFMAKFVIFAKRRDINEANVRVFCMTDDKEEKTLEVQEHYTLIARSRDVEVLDGQVLYLEFGGNLLPTHLGARGGRSSALLVRNSMTLINEQLAFSFFAFQENRLAFAVRLREVGQEPSGRIAFMEDSLKYLASLNPQQRAYLNERRRRAVCTLGVQLPAMCVHYDNILGTPKRNSYYASSRIGDLTLADIAAELAAPGPARANLSARGRGGARTPDSQLETDSLNQLGESTSVLSQGSSVGAYSQQPRRPDWMELAPKLGIPRDEVEFIAEHCGAGATKSEAVSPALLLLMHWFRLSSPDDRDQDLARGLQAIGREDIAQKLNFPIEPKRISRSTAELLREIEMIPVRSTENLYGSELSGYAGFSRAGAAASRGTSLRRLDQNLPGELRDSLEEERRRRADSTSPIQQKRADDYFATGQKVPAIEVSGEDVQPIKRTKMEDAGRPQAAGQQVARAADSLAGGDGSHGTFAQQQQQLAYIEQMARDLVDSTLSEAYEGYLRSQLQVTADETVRAAFAAATGGARDRDVEVGSSEWLNARHGRSAVQEPESTLDEVYDGDDDATDQYDQDGDDEDDEDTLNARLAAAADWRQSSSPSRFDGADLFQDLSEMSNCADRIDSILEQTASEHSTHSGSRPLSARSVLPFAALGAEQMTSDRVDSQQSDADEVD